jgi:hypothetical protein
MTLIIAMWDNLQRIWTYRNTRFHQNDNETVARYKREEMDRRIPTIWGKQEAVRDNMLPFQARRFVNRSTVESLHYESKRCWANLAEMYTEEAQMPVSSDTYSLLAYLSARIYDGSPGYVSAIVAGYCGYPTVRSSSIKLVLHKRN